MKNRIITTRTAPPVTSEGSQAEIEISKLPEHEFKLCQTVTKYNQLLAFKLDAEQVLDWKDSLIKTFGEVDIQRLDYALDKMISGEISFDKNLGIQNVIQAYKGVKKSNNEFRVKKFIW